MLGRLARILLLATCSWVLLLACGYLSVGVWDLVLEDGRGAWSTGTLHQFVVVDLWSDDLRVVLVGSLLHAAGLALLLAPATAPLRTVPSTRDLRWSIVGASVVGGFAALLALSAMVDGAWLLSAMRDEGDSLGTHLLKLPELLLAWTAAGGVWAWLLWRRSGVGGVRARLRELHLATALELVLSVPIYLMLRKRYSCSCAFASFLGLVAGSATLLWLCGPWALLYLLRRRHG